MFSGSIVALVTPFKNGEVDYEKLRELVSYHLENGTNGIVPVGTTGESPTLSSDEKYKVIKTVVETVKGKVPVIAGTGTNSTKTTIEQTKVAKELKADGALIVTPYYNKPTQEGLYRHYEAIAKSVSIPIVIYNVPGRTSVNILPETVARLSKIKNISTIKEASGDIEQIKKIFSLCGITVLSGDDALTFSVMQFGGKGVISVVANIIPREVSQLCSALNSGDMKKGKELHTKFSNLFKALFIETNPIPVKTAMELMGMMGCELRLPLCEMGKDNREKLKSALKEYSLI